MEKLKKWLKKEIQQYNIGRDAAYRNQDEKKWTQSEHLHMVGNALREVDDKIKEIERHRPKAAVGGKRRLEQLEDIVQGWAKREEENENPTDYDRGFAKAYGIICMKIKTIRRRNTLEWKEGVEAAEDAMAKCPRCGKGYVLSQVCSCGMKLPHDGA